MLVHFLTKIYLFHIIIGILIQTTHTKATYELNRTIPMDRALNIMSIALAPKPIITENNKTVDMVIALQQKLIYITSSTFHNPDIRFVCDCFIIRVDWVEDGIFIVSTNMVILVDPFNFRNKTVLLTTDTIVYADYRKGSKSNFISICYKSNRVQLFDNATSVLNISTAQGCQTMTFDWLAYYLHFYDDNFHFFVNLSDLSVSNVSLFRGPIASVTPQNECSFNDKILSISKTGYLAEWKLDLLVFQRLLDSSLNKSSKIHLELTTGCQFLAIYSEEGLEGTLQLWQFENNQNILLNWHKNISSKYGIKSIDSENNKIILMNDINQYKIFIRVQVSQSNFNILWVIVPGAAVILIVIIVIIIKKSLKKKEQDAKQESRIPEKHLQSDIIRKSKSKIKQQTKIKQRMSKGNLEQAISNGDLQEPINSISNFYANSSNIESRKSKQKTGGSYGKKMMVQESIEKSNKMKYTQKRKQIKDDGKKLYYQFNSEIDEYVVLDRPPE